MHLSLCSLRQAASPQLNSHRIFKLALKFRIQNFQGKGKARDVPFLHLFKIHNIVVPSTIFVVSDAR